MILDLQFWILDWGRERRQRYSLRGLRFNARPNHHSGQAGDSWREPESRRLKRTWLPACAGMTFVAVAIASAFIAIVSAAEVPKWKEGWQRVVEAAKREGQLSLYGGQEITHPDIIAAFNKEYPFIKITSASGRAADMLNRIVAERRADKYLADLTASGPNGPRMLYLNKILDPITPALILPEVTDTSKWYGGKHWYADPENKYIFMFEGYDGTFGQYQARGCGRDQVVLGFIATQMEGEAARPRSARRRIADPRIDSLPPTWAWR